MDIHQTQSDNRPMKDPRPTRSVGALAAAWTFTSDHLPAACQVQFLGSQHTFASWNMLNGAFMRYISNDEQGLLGSRITEEHQPDSDGIYLRDKSTVRTIQEMLDAGLTVLCAQEAGTDLRRMLREALAESHPSYRILAGAPEQMHDSGIIVYNSDELTVDAEQTVEPYPNQTKYIQSVVFRTSSDQRIRIVNTHVPGGPENGPGGRDGLRSYLERTKHECPELVFADYNHDTDSVVSLLNSESRSWTSLCPVYYTHVDVEQDATRYDGVLLRDDGAKIVSAQPIEEISTFCADAAEACALINS